MKKSRATTALVAVTKNKSSALTTRDRKRTRSLFGERATEIFSLIEADNKDGATVLIYKQLLSMLVDLVPVAEKAVRNSEGARGIYQLNMMSSQIRELLTDMQAVQDRGMVGRNMVERYVRPSFLDIAMMLVDSIHRLQSEVLTYVPATKHDKIKQAVRETQKGIGEYVQAQYQSVSENIVKGLT